MIAKDVGGSYGVKMHVYPDEMATAALSVFGRTAEYDIRQAQFPERIP